MGSYYAEKQYNDQISEEDAKIEWADDMSEKFYEAVKKVLRDEVFSEEIATDLAWALSQKSPSESTYFYDSFGLERVHAVCFLNDVTGAYGDEVAVEWKKYLNRDRD